VAVLTTVAVVPAVVVHIVLASNTARKDKVLGMQVRIP